MELDCYGTISVHIVCKHEEIKLRQQLITQGSNIENIITKTANIKSIFQMKIQISSSKASHKKDWCLDQSFGHAFMYSLQAEKLTLRKGKSIKQN